MPRESPDIPVAAVASPGEGRLVLGVPIEDAETRYQVRKVLCTALAMGTLAIITGAIAISSNDDYGSGIIASFAIPLCGYIAVKNKSRSCLRAFIVWNALCAGLFVVTAIIISSSYIPLLNCVCDLNCDPGGRYQNINFGNRTASARWRQICSNKDDALRGYYASIIVGAVTAFLQVLGCIWGRQLEENAYFAVSSAVDGMPVAVIGTPYQAQPGGGPGVPGYPVAYMMPQGYATTAYGGQPQAAYSSYQPGMTVMSAGGQLNYTALHMRQPVMMGPPPGSAGAPGYSSRPPQGGGPGPGPPIAAWAPPGGTPAAPAPAPERPRCEPA